jgi:hypothetical protein
MRNRILWAMLALGATSCAGRHIYYVRGCEERLGIPEKRMECRICVERPMPHEYLPDNPPGARCVRR